MKIKQIIICLLIACTLFSCDNSEIESSDNETLVNQDSPVVKKLLAKGYKIENIQETKDFYLVEGDLMFSKKIEDYRSSTNRHASTNNLVTPEFRVVTVFFDTSIAQSGVDDWSGAIIAAMSNWSNLSGTSIKFVRVFSGADIIIKSDYGLLPNNVIAAAGFPYSNGKAYSIIDINLDFNSNQNVSLNTKIYNVVHELGHCIGLRHTNWESEGYYDQNGILIGGGTNLIPNTPSQDPNSVMNSGTALYSWNGFSTYDVIAVNYLYPPLSCNTRLIGPNENQCAFDVFGDPMDYTIEVAGAKQTTTDDGSTWQVSGNSFDIIGSTSSLCKIKVKANNTSWPATATITKTTTAGCITTYNVSLNNCRGPYAAD